MVLTTPTGQLHFPPDFDEVAESEMTPKGYLVGGVVELPDGRRFAVTFYDPVRAAQDVEASGEYGVPVLAEPGLILIPEVTRDFISRAIPELVRQGFFDHLKPTGPTTFNGVAHTK